MALNHSPEFRSIIVQIVCVVEIQFESSWTLTNTTLSTTCHAKFYASKASSSEDFNIFLCISMVQPQDTLKRIHIEPWGHFLNKLCLGLLANATHQISSTWAYQFWRSILHFQTEDPHRRASLDPRASN